MMPIYAHGHSSVESPRACWDLHTRDIARAKEHILALLDRLRDHLLEILCASAYVLMLRSDLTRDCDFNVLRSAAATGLRSTR